ncbi:hypothetical protein BDD12DRAFT_809088 [Trichophaea hybrida]|nr:hypothetical protein BDD12DRAFT_809088 [Trichophaea hybrida]
MFGYFRSLPERVHPLLPASNAAKPTTFMRFFSTIQRMTPSQSITSSVPTGCYSQLVDIVNTVATNYPSGYRFNRHMNKVHPAERFTQDAKIFHLAFGVILLVLMIVTACRGYLTNIFKHASPFDLTILLSTLICIPFASSPTLTNYYFNHNTLPLYIIALLGVQFLIRFIQDYRRTDVYRVCGTGFEGKDKDRIITIESSKSSKPKLQSEPKLKTPMKEPKPVLRNTGSKPILAEIQHAMFGSVSGEFGATLTNPHTPHDIYGRQFRKDEIHKSAKNDSAEAPTEQLSVLVDWRMRGSHISESSTEIDIHSAHPEQPSEPMGSEVSRSHRLDKAVQFCTEVDVHSAPTRPTASTGPQILRLSKEAEIRAATGKLPDSLTWNDILKRMRPKTPPPKEHPATSEEIKQRDQFQLSLDSKNDDDRELMTTDQHRQYYTEVLGEHATMCPNLADEKLYFDTFDMITDDLTSVSSLFEVDFELLKNMARDNIYLHASVSRWQQPVPGLKERRKDDIKEPPESPSIDIKSTTSSIRCFLNRETADTMDMEGDIHMPADMRKRTSAAKLTTEALKIHTRREKIKYKQQLLEPPKEDITSVEKSQPPLLKTTDKGGFWKISRLLTDGQDRRYDPHSPGRGFSRQSGSNVSFR